MPSVISDPVTTLRFLFLESATLPCLDASDADDSGRLDVTDATIALGSLFLDGPAPEAPFDACGTDATVDDLDCAEFPPCAAGP